MVFLHGFTLHYKNTIELRHKGDCSLIGIAPDLTICVEEIYTEDAWIAQHVIQLDGTFLSSVDENDGQNKTVQSLDFPAELTRTQPVWHTMKQLNYSGPRHRGMRENERVTEIVRPFTVQERMGVINRFKLDIAPPLLLGLAESYVLAEIQILRAHLYIVCRRIRLAYALSETQVDAENQPYDYDTRVVYLAHWYDKRAPQEPTLLDLLDTLPEADLYRPMDCILCQDHLFIADGGGDLRQNRVHVWSLERPPASTSESD